ncbi:hypothetical protein SUGI_0346430 [Cryptomeria japonica]|nr:hypothetical protein SUGI_0346430 [Cryptomeria japonica]
MARSRKGLNDLPDSLLCLILNKVSLDQAIRCSVLSKRWKLLWRFLPKLCFSDDMFNSSTRLLKIHNIIDGILKLHSAPLEAFHFYGGISTVVSNAKIDEWIHYAALKDVRDIFIQFLVDVEVPTSVFSCRNLRDLFLINFDFENMPGSFAGFACLTSLNFHNVKLNDTTFKLMLQLCPVLEILVVRNCHGLERVKICSSSLCILELDFPSSSHEIKSITARCPGLEILKLRVMYHVEKMEFELPDCSDLSTTVSRLEPFTTLKSLMKMAFLCGIFESNVSLLHNFPDLEQLWIDNARSLTWGVVQDISGPAPLLENLERVHLNVTSLDDSMPLLAYLLKNAPEMKTLIVSRQKGFDGALEFVNTLFNLPRASEEAKILLSLNNFKGSERSQL